MSPMFQITMNANVDVETKYEDPQPTLKGSNPKNNIADKMDTTNLSTDPIHAMNKHNSVLTIEQLYIIPI